MQSLHFSFRLHLFIIAGELLFYVIDKHQGRLKKNCFNFHQIYRFPCIHTWVDRQRCGHDILHFLLSRGGFHLATL